jgi:hypothetical protein
VRRLRAVFVDGDGIFLIYTDGTLERLLPGGHPRPGCAYSTARHRR